MVARTHLNVALYVHCLSGYHFHYAVEVSEGRQYGIYSRRMCVLKIVTF